VRAVPVPIQRSLIALLGSAVFAAPCAATPAHSASPPDRSLTLVIDRGAKVAIRRAPASRTQVVAGWRTPFGSVRRLRVVQRRGDWFAVESDVLGNGVVGWVPATAAVRLRWARYDVEADLSERLLTLREDGHVVFRRRVSIGASDSPTPSGRFHVTDQLSGARWRLGCCIVVLSGSQPRLPAGWSGGDRLAVHGTPGARERIGTPVSAGCLHATEQTLEVLARLPLGTPVVVHP
jgi:lipoprotein-anchoring transpeptidase ErfK/SrfK